MPSPDKSAKGQKKPSIDKAADKKEEILNEMMHLKAILGQPEFPKDSELHDRYRFRLDFLQKQLDKLLVESDEHAPARTSKGGNSEDGDSKDDAGKTKDGAGEMKDDAGDPGDSTDGEPEYSDVPGPSVESGASTGQRSDHTDQRSGHTAGSSSNGSGASIGPSNTGPSTTDQQFYKRFIIF